MKTNGPGKPTVDDIGMEGISEPLPTWTSGGRYRKEKQKTWRKQRTLPFFIAIFYYLSDGKKCFNFVKKLVGSVVSSEFWSATLSWADLGVGWGDRCSAFVCQIFYYVWRLLSKINSIYVAGKRLRRFLSGSAPVLLSFKNSNLTVKWSLHGAKKVSFTACHSGKL